VLTGAHADWEAAIGPHHPWDRQSGQGGAMDEAQYGLNAPPHAQRMCQPRAPAPPPTTKKLSQSKRLV
jgi:hypothetical protein